MFSCCLDRCFKPCSISCVRHHYHNWPIFETRVRHYCFFIVIVFTYHITFLRRRNCTFSFDNSFFDYLPKKVILNFFYRSLVFVKNLLRRTLNKSFHKLGMHDKNLNGKTEKVTLKLNAKIKLEIKLKKKAK